MGRARAMRHFATTRQGKGVRRAVFRDGRVDECDAVDSLQHVTAKVH